MPTASGAFFRLIYLEAAKFVMLGVFALLETDLTKNESQTTGEYCKKSMTSGWRSSLKNVFPWTPHLACSRLQDSGEKSFSKKRV